MGTNNCICFHCNYDFTLTMSAFCDVLKNFLVTKYKLLRLNYVTN